MTRLLLLSCGTNACFHIAKIIKEKFGNDFYIVGCDVNKKWNIPTGVYLDDFFQCPFSNDENYYQFVLGICKKKKIDWLLPSFDSDQFLFGCDNKDLEKMGVNSFGISSVLEFYKDKRATNEYLESIGIPVPTQYIVDQILKNENYFIKPIHGVGSIGACIKKGEDIRQLKNPENYLIQEVCAEPEFTLECFLYDGKVYSVARERLSSKSGVCTKARVFQDKALESVAYRLAEKTELPHIFNMQFMKNAQGDFVCTDLNLRTAGGMALSYAAGWDEVSALANIMLKKTGDEITASIEKKIQEQYVVRHYEEAVTKVIKNKIAFDLDGTLLDSRNRHQLVMKDVLKNHHLDLAVSDLVDFKSYGKNNMDWLLSNDVSESDAKEINKEWISLIENENYLKNDVLYPGAMDLLEELSEENDLFLITARSNKTNAFKQIKNLGIAQYFTDVDVVPSNTETSTLKTERLRERKVNCFVGDTESDYKAALIAGCEFKAVSYGFRNEKFWNERNIKYIRNIDQFKI